MQEGSVEARFDFNERPFIVIWETTQACDLACVHCRACAQPLRSTLELSTDEAKRLIDEVAALRAPVFVLTGGDPLKRPDIFELVEYASTHGVRISLTPSATPLLTQEASLLFYAYGPRERVKATPDATSLEQRF